MSKFVCTLSAIETDSENLSPIIYYTSSKTDNLNSKNKAIQLTLPLFRFSLYLTDLLFKLFAKKQTIKINQIHLKKYDLNKDFAQNSTGFTIRKTN